MAYVEPKLDRRSHLVDVLPAGARGADESLPYLVFREEDCFRNANHIGMVTFHAPGGKQQAVEWHPLKGVIGRKKSKIANIFPMLFSLLPKASRIFSSNLFIL